MTVFTEQRKNSSLTLSYEFAWLSNSCNEQVSSTMRCGTDTFMIVSSQIDYYKFSFYPRTVSDCNVLLISDSQLLFDLSGHKPFHFCFSYRPTDMHCWIFIEQWKNISLVEFTVEV